MASYELKIAGAVAVTITDGLGALDVARAAAKTLAGVRVGQRVEVRDGRNGRRVGLYVAQSVARVEVQELFEPDTETDE